MRSLPLILALTLAACNDPASPPQPSPTPVEKPEPECPSPFQCNEP